MSFINYRFLLTLVSLNLLLWGFIPGASALKLPDELKASLMKVLPVERIRLDGAIETKNGALYLPLIPTKTTVSNKTKSLLKIAFPNETAPEALLFNDGWCFLKVIHIQKECTFVAPSTLPEELQKAIFSAKLAADLISPENFSVPLAMKQITGTTSVIAKDVVEKKPDEQSKSAGHRAQRNTANGFILVTSPASGKVSLLSYPELAKIIEFPMDGTPSGATYANGKIYIADQSKGRILKLDPYNKIFLGQIDLPKGSAPKDVTALWNGRLIYVSENMLSDIAVFETDTDKLLVRTKVNSFPGKMALTPDGKTLLILSVPVGKLSILDTQNQRFLGTISVSSLPSGIALDSSGKTAYISNRVANTISVIDLVHHTLVLVLKTGIGPTGLVIDADDKKLYVANAKDNSLTIFDLGTNKKINDIKLPLDLDFPSSLTLLPNNKHILVSSASTDEVGLFDTTTQTFEKIVSVGHNSDQCLWVPAQ